MRGKKRTEVAIRNIRAAKIGSKNPMWKGGRWINSDGYVFIHMPNHPNCDRDGYVFEHRYVMEQRIGRYLTEDEEVHHINENRADNRIENLELTDPSAHMSKHRKMDIAKGKALFGGKNRWGGQWRMLPLTS